MNIHFDLTSCCCSNVSHFRRFAKILHTKECCAFLQTRKTLEWIENSKKKRSNARENGWNHKNVEHQISSISINCHPGSACLTCWTRLSLFHFLSLSIALPSRFHFRHNSEFHSPPKIDHKTLASTTEIHGNPTVLARNVRLAWFSCFTWTVYPFKGELNHDHIRWGGRECKSELCYSFHLTRWKWRLKTNLIRWSFVLARKLLTFRINGMLLLCGTVPRWTQEELISNNSL